MRKTALACLIGLFLAPATAATAGLGSVLHLDRFQLYVAPDGEIAEKNITEIREVRTSGGLPLHDSFGSAVPLGSFSGSALSAAGVNKARSSAEGGSASGYTDGASWSAGLNVASVWFERFTVTGGTGTGQLTLSVVLDGQLSVSGPGNDDGLSGLASIGFNVLTTTGGFSLFDGGYHPTRHGLAFACDDPTDCDYGIDLTSVGHYYEHTYTGSSVLQRVDATVSFTYGVPFYVIGALEASSYAYQLGAQASSDFYNTARVDTLTAPANAVVWVESGAYASFGLTAPVPEPSTWLMLLGGLAVTGAATRRRNS